MAKQKEDLEDLNNQIEAEKDTSKKAWLEYIRDFALGKKSKNERALKEIKEIDVNLRRALTLILNYYAESEGQFNQQLLDDAVLLINKRRERVARLK